jgi:hypothetical protein
LPTSSAISESSTSEILESFNKWNLGIFQWVKSRNL